MLSRGQGLMQGITVLSQGDAAHLEAIGLAGEKNSVLGLKQP